MNSKQVAILNSQINKFIETNFTNIPNFSNIQDESQYLQLFDTATKDVDNILSATFILPNGKLKKHVFDLSNFEINNIIAINFNITNKNIYDFINLKHELVKFLGFDLQKLLDFGCIRIGNNKINKEVFLQLHLTHRINKKIENILEDCLIYYDNVIIDYTGDEKQIDKYLKYSSKNGDTSKDIVKDLNCIFAENIF